MLAIPFKSSLSSGLTIPSKKHIFYGAFLFAELFTYAGVEIPIWIVHTHLDYNLNFMINTLVIYGIWRWVYFLNFKAGTKLWINILLSLVALFCWESFASVLFEYEAEDFAEMYSITFPFGTLLLVVFNYYYHLNKQGIEGLRSEETDARGEGLANLKTEVKNNSNIWLDTVQGKTKLEEHAILYARLRDVGLTVKTQAMSHTSFYSLKQFEQMLSDKDRFYRLNKQYVASSRAIRSYKALKDGRLKVTLVDDEVCFVSKNKAARLKQWLNSFNTASSL